MWLPVFFWMGVIFTLSSIPTLPAPKIIWWDFLLKKSAHVIEYAILYYFVYRALSKGFKNENLELRIGKKKVKINLALCSFLLVLSYAFSDEFHQSFVPGRHCKLMDIGFDSLGMIISQQWLKKRNYVL